MAPSSAVAASFVFSIGGPSLDKRWGSIRAHIKKDSPCGGMQSILAFFWAIIYSTPQWTLTGLWGEENCLVLDGSTIPSALSRPFLFSCQTGYNGRYFFSSAGSFLSRRATCCQSMWLTIVKQKRHWRICLFAFECSHFLPSILLPTSDSLPDVLVPLLEKWVNQQFGKTGILTWQQTQISNCFKLKSIHLCTRPNGLPRVPFFSLWINRPSFLSFSSLLSRSHFHLGSSNR